MASDYDLGRVLHLAAVRLAEAVGLLTDPRVPVRLQRVAPSPSARLLGVARVAPLLEVDLHPDYTIASLTVLVSEPVYLDGNSIVCGGLAASINPLDLNVALLAYTNTWLLRELDATGLPYSELFSRVQSIAKMYLDSPHSIAHPRVAKTTVTARKGTVEVVCERYVMGRLEHVYFCVDRLCTRDPDFTVNLAESSGIADAVGDLARTVAEVSSQLVSLLRLARFATVVWHESLKPS